MLASSADMGAVIGLLLGTGLALIWFTLTEPPPAPRTQVSASGVQSLLARAGVEGVTTAGVVMLCTSSAVVAGIVMLAISRTAPVAMVFALLAAYLPMAVLRGRARRRQHELAELWPEAVDNLGSAVRAGLSLPEALAQLSERGPQPLREPFAKFAADYQSSGRFNESLDVLKQRLADPVGDRVVEGLRVAREGGGGDLGRVLRTLSAFLRDDLRTRAELEARRGVDGERCALGRGQPLDRAADAELPTRCHPSVRHHRGDARSHRRRTDVRGRLSAHGAAGPAAS